MGRLSDEEIQEYVDKYCGNEMKKLKEMLKIQLFKDGVPQSSYDDYYSIANYSVYQAALAFDPDKNDNFEGWMMSCIKRRFYSAKRNEMRQKRSRIITYVDENGAKNQVQEAVVSFDDVVTENGLMLQEVVDSGYNLEAEIFNDDEEFNEKRKKLNKSLSMKSRKIVDLICDGYKPNQICAILNITMKQYNDAIRECSNYKNLSILLG